MTDSLNNYRNHLVDADQKSQEDFDKTLITVATSSLGVSLVFIREFIGEGPVASPGAIILAWSLLASSVGCVLLGFYLSRFALRKAMSQIDEETIHSEKPGGKISAAVEILNGTSGVLLLLGIGSVIYFATHNLPVDSVKGEIMSNQNENKSDGQRGYVPPPPPPPPKPIGTGKTGYMSGYNPPPPPPAKPTTPPKK